MAATAPPRPQRDPIVAPGRIEHHAADMAVVVAADVTLGEAQECLASAGQWLALDGDAYRPIGWLMQHDSTGPLRLGFGGWRDLLTGVQCIGGHGELVTTGGVTVKNVAGYDLVKFAVGSHGCFGQPVSVTLRTYRLPEAALAATLGPEPAVIQYVLTSDAPPQWMLWTPDGMRAGWLGREREIAALHPIVAQLCGGAVEQRSLRDDEAERRRRLHVGAEVLRLYLRPAELFEVVNEIRPSHFAADPVFGVAWMGVPERFSDVLAIVRARGGHATWLGRDGVRVYGVRSEERAVLERLKKQLDPAGRLPSLPFER